MRTRLSTIIAASLLGLMLPIAARSQPSVFDYAGTWKGTYTAAQGITGVVLVIEPIDDARIIGHFIFFPENSNATVPSGHYTIEGEIDRATGRMSFDGKKWITRPEGYIFVGFAGALSGDDLHISGNVSDLPQGIIGTFSVERLSSCAPKAGPGASPEGR